MLSRFNRRDASALAALLAVGCSAPAGSQSLDDTRADVMQRIQFDAQIESSFYDTGTVDQVHIRFQIANDGALPIAVLGVGSSGTQSLPLPNYDISAVGDLTISHGMTKASADTLAGRRATYAHKVLPQTRYENSHTLKLLSRYPVLTGAEGSAVQPKRLRYCVAVAPFGAEKFTPVGDAKTVWLVQATVADDQSLLCSQWFDLASR